MQKTNSLQLPKKVIPLTHYVFEYDEDGLMKTLTEYNGINATTNFSYKQHLKHKFNSLGGWEEIEILGQNSGDEHKLFPMRKITRSFTF
jgi:hypothetical protein|tara:strand:- start:807 stop:1073 length:267 start_codon:yes stop_codon:yes gene_type:complete